MNPRPTVAFSPYTVYSRDDWARAQGRHAHAARRRPSSRILSGLTERVSIARGGRHLSAAQPAAQFLCRGAAGAARRAPPSFLRKGDGKMPFIIGLAGSVAVGKSTTGRVLQALLARWPSHPRVELVPTDGFLFPNAVLEERGLMTRKGFPGELRPDAAAELSRRGEVGQRAHRGAGLFPSRL